MDHVIEYILNYMYGDLEEFKNEWFSGKYNKMSDCPSYCYIKAYCDAIKPLAEFDSTYRGITPSSLLKEEN